MNYSKLIIVVSHVPVFASVIYALIIYKQLQHELKVFFWFLFLTGILQFVSLLLWTKSINNMPLLHVYVIVSFVSLAWYYNSLMKDFIHRYVIIIAAGLFCLLSLLNSLFVQPVFSFNSYALTLESALLIILSLSAYILLLKKIVAEKKKGEIKSLNWINSGVFIYYSSTLLIFYFGDLITHSYSRSFNRYTWVLHSFLSIVMYTCFIIGLWKRQAK
ncbi:MAG: hypothetical protein FD123_2377 [Bacteroidetes bacterium]|nr:MAG: hypothetical protein FD123_2377 [Bacteroidota bacterium]